MRQLKVSNVVVVWIFSSFEVIMIVLNARFLINMMIFFQIVNKVGGTPNISNITKNGNLVTIYGNIT